MPDLEGLDHLVQGVVGAITFAGLFAAARYRFSQRERSGGPADIGLD